MSSEEAEFRVLAPPALRTVSSGHGGCSCEVVRVSVTGGGGHAPALPAAALRAWRSPLGNFVTCWNRGGWFAWECPAGLVACAAFCGLRGARAYANAWAGQEEPWVAHVSLQRLLHLPGSPHSAPTRTSPQEQPPCPEFPARSAGDAKREARRRGLLPRTTLSALSNAPKGAPHHTHRLTRTHPKAPRNTLSATPGRPRTHARAGSIPPTARRARARWTNLAPHRDTIASAGRVWRVL